MKRLNEENDSDVEGVFHTLGVFENMISLRPELAETLVSTTDTLPWLLKRITKVEYNQNKQYSSELLAIILQDSTKNRSAVLKEKDGLDCILQAISVSIYKHHCRNLNVTVALHEERSKRR